MRSFDKILLGIGIGTCMTAGSLTIMQNRERLEIENERNKIPPPTEEETYQVIKNYDFETGTYKHYSDEEIRIMREKHSFNSEGSYIYTPARVVPSREEEIENYLEDNPQVIEEIYDKYRD